MTRPKLYRKVDWRAVAAWSIVLATVPWLCGVVRKWEIEAEESRELEWASRPRWTDANRWE